MAEYVIDTPLGRVVGDRLLIDPDLHMPHLASIETASVIRGWARGGRIDERLAARALIDLSDLAAERYAHEPYLTRVWALRHNISAYDAVYVALAEALGATLLTCDARLGRAPLTDVSIEVISRPSKN